MVQIKISTFFRGKESIIGYLILTKIPMGLIQTLWWKYFPGVKVKIAWPLDQPADPNEHYRPWIEKHIGKQGWDWDWTMEDNDAAENLLTLKVCKSKSKYATIAALQWSK